VRNIKCPMEAQPPGGGYNPTNSVVPLTSNAIWKHKRGSLATQKSTAECWHTIRIPLWQFNAGLNARIDLCATPSVLKLPSAIERHVRVGWDNVVVEIEQRETKFA
jgi:hypothetical protein